MIVYKEIKNSNQDIIQVKVFLDNQRIGSIEKEVGGWRYCPKGKSEGGDLLATIEAVKKSLTSDGVTVCKYCGEEIKQDADGRWIDRETNGSCGTKRKHEPE